LSHRPLKVMRFLPYLLLSAPSSPHLIFFECAFELSTIKGSVFPTLPPFECVSSPHLISFRVRLRALDH
jgi:hypothetical protein